MGRPSYPVSAVARRQFVTGHHHHSHLHGCPWWRTCQLVVMTTALVSIYTCALLYAGVTAARQQQVQRPRPVTWLQRDQLLAPPESELADLTDFRYLLKPEDVCRTPDAGALYFLIYVHSAPEHFQARQTIRRTWGSLRRIATLGVRVVFLLGLAPSEALQSRLATESATHGDLVQGNFIDSYRNLSYKHLMGHKWALSSCWRSRYLVKTDDDVFVDVRQLATLLDNLYGTASSGNAGVLACSVWQAGSAPQRLPSQKWAVDLREYPYDAYPAYCGGLAYVLSTDVARDLLAASRHVPLFWIDDLYVTGLLAETLPHLHHHALNLRITYDSTVLERWLRERGRERPCPHVFGDVSAASNNSALMEELWWKTARVWGDAAGERRMVLDATRSEAGGTAGSVTTAIADTDEPMAELRLRKQRSRTRTKPQL